MAAVSSSDNDIPPPKPTRLKHPQKYVEKWECNPKFRGWLCRSKEGPTYFHCKACNSHGKAGKSEIERHAETKKHKHCVETVRKTPSVLEMTRVTSSSSGADGSETSTVYVNGKKIIVKQEDASPPCYEESDTEASSLVLYPMNRVLTTQDGVPRLALECQPSYPTTVHSSPADVVILKSKPKNPDYKVQNDVLATKRGKPVNFKLVRGKPGVRIAISLTYQGHIYGDEPVKRCKKHDECNWCKEHLYNQGFCIISKFHHYELDHREQPTAILRPLAEHLDHEGSTEFSVVFSCWNSCDVHARCGKDMTLHIQISDSFSQLRKTEYTVQCCQNLLRDAFKDRKRKLLSQLENSQECAAKMASTPAQDLPAASPPSSPSSVKKEKSVDIVVEGLDEERRDLIERLVRTIGGNTYRIPHLVRLKPCDTSTTEEHKKNCNNK